MVSVREQVIDYIKIKYRTSGEYKCSVSEIRKALTAKPSFSSTPSSISVAVSALKSEGTLTALDEKDPERKGKGGMPSYLITLTEILEEITSPKIEKEKMTKVPAQTTSVTVATNPFDKVNSQLGELLSKVNGLATGYSQSVELMQAIRNALMQEESHTLNAVSALREELRNPPGLNIQILSDEINARLSDFSRNDSFIYRVREELYDRVDKTEDKLLNEVTRLLQAIDSISVPSSVANADDYKAGIREGIKLAAELGITLKSSE